jgi:hypothetical protein
MNWLLLVVSLPTENATLRMRLWRQLKSAGAAILRDGAYLLPFSAPHESQLDALAAQTTDAGGSAFVMKVEPPGQADFAALFDRSAEFASLVAAISADAAQLAEGEGKGDGKGEGKGEGKAREVSMAVQKLARKHRKTFATLAEIDFFPTAAQAHTELVLAALERDCNRALSPGEPQFASGGVVPVDARAFQARLWATRARLWVDRLACVWLIKRFIDPQASFLWLADPKDCPANAVGFDFDGAQFTHVGTQVTFEVLLASFGLVQAEFKRLAAIVHYIDVSGIEPPEARGVESVLAGLRASLTDDDALVLAASSVFDGLLMSFKTRSPL